MFTGIIAATGRVATLKPMGGDLRLAIDTGKLDLSAPEMGESIAVNGVCLTAQDFDGPVFWADVSAETLAMTTIGDWAEGQRVNLERALRADTRLGGHFVSGHVDGIAAIVSRREDARSLRVELEVPAELAKYIARKGSVALDGTSLTVNGVSGSRFDVNIVPHTAEVTTIGDWADGTRVNLEVDVVARYLERLIEGRDLK